MLKTISPKDAILDYGEFDDGVTPEEVSHARTAIDWALLWSDDVYEFPSIPTPAATPTDFAEFFPSTRRLVIKHDDEPPDGNMNLRVDTESFSRASRLTLFHSRMLDLKNREFSLRRYSRDSRREVVNRRRHFEERSRKIICLDDITKAPRRGPLIKNRRHHPTTPSSRKYLPGTINDIPVHAIPDTGSSRNIISAAFAYRHRFPISPSSEASTYKFANRATAAAVGQVQLNWSFAGSTATTHLIEFTVLKGFAHDVAIGCPFLLKTETMSTNSHRLRDREPSIDYRHLYAVNSVGDPTQRLHGTLNGCVTTALPDSGSERNVIDKGFAESRGLRIDPTEKVWLRFGDGSVRRTIGQVRAHWGMSSDWREDSEVVFDVLEDCAYDVILGDELLYERDVFGRWSQCLEDVWEEESEWETFCLISVFEGCFGSWRGRKSGSGGPGEDEWMEWTRKSTAESQYRIEVEAVLGPDRNSPAWRDELRRRKQWVLENPPPSLEPAPRVARMSRSGSPPICRVVSPLHGAASAPIPLMPVRGMRVPRYAATVAA